MKAEVIWLNSVDSTNEEMKRLLKSKKLIPNYTVVAARFQTRGRGQRNAVWNAEFGQNITMSVYFQPNNLKTNQAFSLNKAVSVLIADFLIEKGIKNTKVKWPNDVMIGQKKICGILIENSLNSDAIMEAIIGVGLNVNQLVFDPEVNATSVRNELNNEFTIEIFLEELVVYLSKVQYFLDRPNLLDTRYLELMMDRGKPQLFEVNGKREMGAIIGLASTGKLRVKFGDRTALFDQKEIRFIFS